MKFLTPGSKATTLTWSGAWDRRLLSLRWGPIFLKGTLRWYWWCLSVSLAVSVGVGNWFPPFQFPQQGVVDAPVAQCGGVNEDGLAVISPGTEVCPCEILLSCLSSLALSIFSCLLNFLTTLIARHASRIAWLLTS